MSKKRTKKIIKVLGFSKISKHYQISIPKRVRSMWKLQAGQRIAFVRKGNDLTIRKD